MKSYSDDIPNVSTQEIKRAAMVTDETNDLVKANHSLMQKFEQSALDSIEQINKKLKIIMVLTAATLISTGAVLFLTLFNGNV